MKPVIPFVHGSLRPIAPEDDVALAALLRDPAVRLYLCDDKILSSEQVAGLIAMSVRTDPDGLGLWVVEPTKGEFAGVVGLAEISGPPLNASAVAGEVEPTIALYPQVWGRGLARSALLAVIAHARETLTLSGLVAAVDTPNENSHRLLRNCGFSASGRAPGLIHELVLYELRFRAVAAK